MFLQFFELRKERIYIRSVVQTSAVIHIAKDELLNIKTAHALRELLTKPT